MNTDFINTTLKPQMALIVYSDERKNNIYLERRDIVNGRMTAGVPVSEDCIRDILSMDLKSNKMELHGAIPRNLIYADGRTGFEKFVWYQPAQKKMHYFKFSLGIPNGELYTPPLLYVVRGNQLAMYAFKGSYPNGKLYMAPFFNVASTHVCLGNAKLENISDYTYTNVIEYWEKLFWQSEFSHILENPVKSNLAVLTKRLQASQEKFPASELIELPFTLKDFIK